MSLVILCHFAFIDYKNKKKASQHPSNIAQMCVLCNAKKQTKIHLYPKMSSLLCSLLSCKSVYEQRYQNIYESFYNSKWKKRK